MSFTVTRFPIPDDIAGYAKTLQLPESAIIRDIARLVTIASMVHEGQLNDDLVLVGGMAMRLRGSPRFTMADTDTSSRTGRAPEAAWLMDALTVSQDALEVTPGDPAGWKEGKQLITAQPVKYEAYFAGVDGAPIVDSFTVTVAWRGLIERPQKQILTHPYPQLELPPTAVPLIDLTEQVAEKIVGWCAHGLRKHYLDVAWAFGKLEDDIDSRKLGRLVDAKLDIGRKLFSTAYAAFPNRESIRPALEDPDGHVPPLGQNTSNAGRQLRYDGKELTKPEAHQFIVNRAIPALFADVPRQ